MPKLSKKRGKEEVNERQKDTLFAFIATFFSIFGVLIALIAKREDRYVMHYTKQSLVLFIISLVFSAIGWMIRWIPIAGNIMKAGLGIFAFILWIISWIYALSGEMKKVPLVWEFAKNIDL